ncbi:hypothetical protein GCM10010399_60290 [Dactylosporangium fulvum]|uniref:YtkA-like domain-containing protein n=1 Tax=Dactylosporangium fulvum TaxID=53359 RepID=A0ABY5W974_9ACTN|nr:hypothetical protein [Dactylosporangium fulvum]UWP84626.1 hypothetical protein Dfulv_10480 [Dactylosporangium fulvum]
MNRLRQVSGPASWWRRAAAALLATVVAVAVAVFGFAESADAHNGVVLTLHGDGRGSVWITATWQDGHPVTEAVGMTMLATSVSGTRVGPVGLQRKGNALAYAGTLQPGEWTVVAEMGTPAIGRCQGTVRVAAADSPATPDETTCAPPPVAVQPSPSAPSRSFTWVWYLLGVLVVTALVTLFAARRRPAAPSRRPAPRTLRPRR